VRLQSEKAETRSGADASEAIQDWDTQFSEHWRDGCAEVSGYRLGVTRYGEPRPGYASLIYVTEPFLEEERVKADDPTGNPEGIFEALKLNLSRDFQTGVYDYNTMTSVFTHLQPGRADLKKLVFSSTEWCGQVFQQLLFRDRAIDQIVASYFEGESTDAPLPWPPPMGGEPLTEDGLFIRLRALEGELLSPGETRVHPFLPSLFWARLTHNDLAWSTAELSRAEAAAPVDVIGGRFVCDRYTIRVIDGRVGVFDVEHEYPHRVVRWRWTGLEGEPYEAADCGELLGTSRMKYWERKARSDVSALKTLGLPPIADEP